MLGVPQSVHGRNEESRRFCLFFYLFKDIEVVIDKGDPVLPVELVLAEVVRNIDLEIVRAGEVLHGLRVLCLSEWASGVGVGCPTLGIRFGFVNNEIDVTSC